MSEIRELYAELIKDHSKRPRNFRVLENADRMIEGRNPLCGDHFTMYLRFAGDVIDEITFQGEGCAISTSSASVMTQLLKGKTRLEGLAIFEQFHELVTGSTEEEIDPETLGKMAVFAGVRHLPVRVKCATLAWHAVKNALADTDEVATTE